MKTIIFILTFSIILLETSFAQSKFVSDLSLEEARKPTQIEGDIDTVKEAIQKAQELGLEKQIDFDELKKRGIKEWRVEANLRPPGYHVSHFATQRKNGIISSENFDKLRNEDEGRSEYWKVTYRSVGIIPSYTCSMGIGKNGEEVKGFFNTCGWNK